MDILFPDAGSGPGVIIAHAWWGLNRTIRDYGAALAAKGFVVGLPDLFDGHVATSIEGAQALADTEWSPDAGARLAGAIHDLAEHPKVTGNGVGAVGFSYSGFHLGRLATEPVPLSGVAIYYATGDFSRAIPPMLVHLAESDAFESAEDMAYVTETLNVRGAPSAAYTYPGTRHWFAEADRPEYDPPAAALAFDRTVKFLLALGATRGPFRT